MTPLNRQVEAEITRVLTERVERLRSGLEGLADEFLDPAGIAGLVKGRAEAAPETTEGGGSAPDFLAHAVRGLSGAGDQIALLDRLLEGASRCFSRVCVFVVREETAHGWSSVGFPESEEGDPAKEMVVHLSEAPILHAAVTRREAVREDPLEGDPEFLPPLRPGDRVPGRALAAPIVLRGVVAAVLYADNGGDGREGGDFASTEILVAVSELAAGALASQSHPAGMEAPSAAAVRVPRAEEGGGWVPATGAAGFDPLEEDLEVEDFDATPSPFPASLSKEESRLHEDARRFARLLVSELLLYHEDLVILGRKHRDIYPRLREDINRSRQAYDQRVPRSVTAQADYFNQELIRTLAAGDPSALGADPGA